MVTTEATRHAAAEVRPLADAMRARLSAYAERAEIGGSLRRGKADVKDIEIILLNPTADFYAYTGKLIEGGHAEQAVYSDGKHRWGMKYRGLLVQGVKVEIFTADSDNWGYQFWLRTGPGDANQVMVTALKYRCGAFNVGDGYLWRGEHKLHVADEVTLFKLFGIPFLEPGARTAAAYKAALGQPSHAWGDPTPYVILPKDEALDDAVIRYPSTWTRENVAWAKGRGLDQSAVDTIEADLAHFRRLAAENREREQARSETFETWWAEHGEERTKMYDGLRGLEVGRTVEVERKGKR
jgi:hypothetical protein